MTFSFEQPPEKLTWYHLDQLIMAEAGTLTYDHKLHRAHGGIANNAVACVWCGLLDYGDDGMVLTDLGRSMLDAWKASPEGLKWLAEEAAWDELEEQDDDSSLVPEHEPLPQEPPRPEQLGLFGGER